MRLCNIFAGALVASLAVMLCACNDRNDLPGNGLPGADDYVGSTREMVLGPEAAGFNGSRFTLVLQTENGTLIRRDGSHMRSGAASRLDRDWIARRRVPHALPRISYCRQCRSERSCR